MSVCPCCNVKSVEMRDKGNGWNCTCLECGHQWETGYVGEKDDVVNRMASFSGGKDSTAMVLRLVEERMVDEVAFCDTGLDFPEILENIEKVRLFLKENDVGFVKLRAERDFEYYMFDVDVKKRGGGQKNGYGWAGPISRWCTSELKTNVLGKYQKIYKNKIVNIGIAYDEQHRLERKCAKYEYKRYPLVEWEMSEEDCLEYCRERGYLTGRMYDLKNRVSCWCCPMQTNADLKVLYHEFPDLFKKLEEWDERVAKIPGGEKFLFKGKRVRDWRERFEREDKAKKEQQVLTAYP